jgi:site-specific recombinase XerD
MEVYFLGLMERVKPLSGYTINNRLRFYRRLYGFWQVKGYVGQNPTLTLSYIRPEKRVKVLVSPPDFAKVIARLRGRHGLYALRDECLLLVAYDSALRLNELLTLKVSSVRFNPDRIIHFMGKGSKERIASFGEETARRLLLYISRRAFAKIPGDLLFCTRDGKPVNSRLGYRVFRCSGKAVDVYLAPHMVRHSTATLIRHQTGDLQLVRDILGHVSVQTTEIYTHSNQMGSVEAYRGFSPVTQALKEAV